MSVGCHRELKPLFHIPASSAKDMYAETMIGGDDDPAFVTWLAEGAEPVPYVSGGIQMVILHDVSFQAEIGGTHFLQRGAAETGPQPAPCLRRAHPNGGWTFTNGFGLVSTRG